MGEGGVVSQLGCLIMSKGVKMSLCILYNTTMTTIGLYKTMKDERMYKASIFPDVYRVCLGVLYRYD